YDTGPLHHWTVTMSFSSVTARLHGLVPGSFKGIEVLKRGSSPRIVSAYVLGSKGRTLVTGPELAARLGLYDAWAYFSVSDSRGVHKEPDLSGPAAAPPAQPAQMSGSGGIPGTNGSESPGPTEVSGSGGIAGTPAPEPQAQPIEVSGSGGILAG
ncbi:MAG TPA: hypothetical protein VK781_08720, partial [Solirubrobacteraceae bacterium]|nr:hypothetical protein [Solirubrobacteraceae bacterium]